jgi:hypothetical protein
LKQLYEKIIKGAAERQDQDYDLHLQQNAEQNSEQNSEQNIELELGCQSVCSLIFP